jgi:hypothetical protein
MRFSQEPLDALSFKLSPPKRILFCASCIQKLAPEMREFLSFYRSKELVQIQDDCMDLLWCLALPETSSDEGWATLTDFSHRIEDSLSPEEGETFLYEGAVEFCNTLYHTLRCRDDGNHLLVSHVASCVINEMENFLILVNDVQPEYRPEPRPVSFLQARRENDEFFDFVYSLPLMKAEIRHQLELINEIAATDVITADFVDRIRRTSAELGVQPFKRGLIPTPLEDSEKDGIE